MNLKIYMMLLKSVKGLGEKTLSILDNWSWAFRYTANVRIGMFLDIAERGENGLGQNGRSYI